MQFMLLHFHDMPWDVFVFGTSPSMFPVQLIVPPLLSFLSMSSFIHLGISHLLLPLPPRNP